MTGNKALCNGGLRSRVYNREREYPTVNMSPESNVTFDHSHVMHVHVQWSVQCSAVQCSAVCSFQARVTLRRHILQVCTEVRHSLSLLYTLSMTRLESDLANLCSSLARLYATQ